jgi:hypothetical protein
MPWTGGDDAIRQLVRQLATMREANPSLRRGSFDELVTERGLVVYERRAGASDVAVVVINGDETRTVDLPFAKLGLDRGDVHGILGIGVGNTLDDSALHAQLAPRAAAVFLIGAAPVSHLPLWSLLVLGIAIAAIAGAVVIFRRRSRLRRA